MSLAHVVRSMTVLGLIASLSLAATSQADAGWKPSDLDPTNKNGGLRKSARNFDNERLKEMSRDPRPGRDYTKVYLENGTDRVISVAIVYLPYDFDRGNSSELKVYDADPWNTRAWFNLKPGQKIHVANTATPNFYYYAEGNNLKWEGTLQRYVMNGGKKELYGFKNGMISAPFRDEHTIRFTR